MCVYIYSLKTFQPIQIQGAESLVLNIFTVAQGM